MQGATKIGTMKKIKIKQSTIDLLCLTSYEERLYENPSDTNYSVEPLSGYLGVNSMLSAACNIDHHTGTGKFISFWSII